VKTETIEVNAENVERLALTAIEALGIVEDDHHSQRRALRLSLRVEMQKIVAEERS
jgi:hypothetical protein